MFNSIKVKGLFLFAFIFTLSLTTEAQTERKTIKTERVATPNSSTETIESKKETNQGAAAETTEKVSTPKTKKGTKTVPGKGTGKGKGKAKGAMKGKAKGKVSTPKTSTTAPKTHKTHKERVSTPKPKTAAPKNKEVRQAKEGQASNAPINAEMTKKAKKSKKGKKGTRVKNQKIKN